MILKISGQINNLQVPLGNSRMIHNPLVISSGQYTSYSTSTQVLGSGLPTPPFHLFLFSLFPSSFLFHLSSLSLSLSFPSSLDVPSPRDFLPMISESHFGIRYHDPQSRKVVTGWLVFCGISSHSLNPNMYLRYLSTSPKSCT